MREWAQVGQGKSYDKLFSLYSKSCFPTWFGQMFINMAFKRAYSKQFLPPALRSFLVLVHLWKNTPPLKIVKYSKSKIRLVPTLLSSKMKGKRAFHILALRASFGSPVPPIGPIQPPTENQHPPYGAAYGWRYPPRLRLCFNSHDGHGSPALPGHGHHSFAFASKVVPVALAQTAFQNIMNIGGFAFNSHIEYFALIFTPQSVFLLIYTFHPVA